MRRSTVHRTLGLLVALATAAALSGAGPASAAKAKSYEAPFKAGPSGGDSFSYHSADSSGTVTVGRVYPIPGAINCTKGGPYAKLLVPVKAPVAKIVVSYDSAAVDNFTFAMVGLHDNKGDWFGTKQLRGFITGSGNITFTPDGGQGTGPLTIEFGLQQSSACPNADAGTIHFSKVQVFS
jgi:hypothetical protein